VRGDKFPVKSQQSYSMATRTVSRVASLNMHAFSLSSWKVSRCTLDSAAGSKARRKVSPRLTPEVATWRPSIAETMVTAGVSTPSPCSRAGQSQRAGPAPLRQVGRRQGGGPQSQRPAEHWPVNDVQTQRRIGLWAASSTDGRGGVTMMSPTPSTTMTRSTSAQTKAHIMF